MKLNLHHVYAVAFVALGAAVAHQDALKAVMSDKAFGLTTMGVGIGVAVFGFLSNQGKD